MIYRESALQRATFAFVRTVLPTAFVTSIAHEKKATDAQRMMERARGVMPGLPDIRILCDGLSIDIELKAGTALSDMQQARRIEIERNGGHWFLCRSIVDVERALRSLGLPLRGTTLSAVERDAALSAKAATPKRAAKPRQRSSARQIAAAHRAGYWAP